jgi:hypothetical protein
MCHNSRLSEAVTPCSLTDTFRSFEGTSLQPAGSWHKNGQSFLYPDILLNPWYLCTKPHGVTSQKRVIFTFNRLRICPQVGSPTYSYITSDSLQDCDVLTHRKSPCFTKSVITKRTPVSPDVIPFILVRYIDPSAKSFVSIIIFTNCRR